MAITSALSVLGRTRRCSQRARLSAVRAGAGPKSAPTPTAKPETNIWRPDCAAVQPSPLFHFTFYLPLPRPHLTIISSDSSVLQRIRKGRILLTLAVIVVYKRLKTSSSVGFFPPFHDCIDSTDTQATVHFMDVWIYFLCCFPPLTLFFFFFFLHPDWEEEQVSSPNILRLIYQGRFLHGNVTLGGEKAHRRPPSRVHKRASRASLRPARRSCPPS